MRQILAILILSLVASMPLYPLAFGDEKNGLMEVEISVQGMTCGGCAAKIKNAVKAVEGVVSVEVELKEEEVEVHAQKGVDPQKLVAAVESAGYKAQLKEVEYE